MKKVGLVLAILILTSLALQAKAFQPKVKLGEKAVPFTLNNYDGNSVSLSDYAGKIVVLEWLNYECPFSRYHHETVNTMVNLANK